MTSSRDAAVARLPAPLLNGIGGGVLLALAIMLWVGASDIDGAGGGLVGPDGFPRLVAALLGGTSLLLVGQAATAQLRRTPDPAVIEVRRPYAVAAAIGLVALYPALIAALGYYAATAVWMMPFLRLAGMRSPAGIVAGTAGFLLFTKVLFQMALGTPLP